MNEKEQQRFYSNIEVGHPDGCWIWTGRRTPNGYGKFFYRGRERVAHRVAYELFCRKIEKGKVLDHICKNRACVNPKHAEQVSPRENTLRAKSTLLRRDALGRHLRVVYVTEIGDGFARSG